jgi:hypothetical protein
VKIINVPNQQRHAHLLAQYVALRRQLRPLHAKIQRTAGRSVILACARKFDMLEGKTLTYENETQLTVLWDYILYRHMVRGKNTVQRYAQKHSSATLERDEALLLEAITKASYRILGIEFIEVGVGMYCRDLLRGQRLFLKDKGFSNTTTPGCVLASNVLDLPEFSMTTGGALPIDRAYAKRLLAVCARAVGAPKGKGGFALTAKAEAELAELVTRTAFEMGWTKQVSYK